MQYMYTHIFKIHMCKKHIIVHLFFVRHMVKLNYIYKCTHCQHSDNIIHRVR